jgi:hypothetical protein
MRWWSNPGQGSPNGGQCSTYVSPEECKQNEKIPLAGGVPEVVECWPSKCKSLSSYPNTPQKKKGKKERKEGKKERERKEERKKERKMC